MAISTEWFQDRLRDRRLSQRQLAKMMGIDPAAVSLMFRGRRKMTVEEAAQIAVLLQSTTAEVMEAAGAPVRGGELVPIRYLVQSGGAVVPVAQGLHDMADAPPGLPAEAVAIQNRAGGLEDGWVYFCGAEHQRPDAALGQYALAAIRDNGVVLAHVRRGYRKGAYNLASADGTTTQAELAWASPVLWIRSST